MAMKPLSENPKHLYDWATKNSPNYCPVGMLSPMAAAVDGWERADGSLRLKTAYPALYSLIGTTYNTGGEATAYFRLPNVTLGGLLWFIKY